MSPASGERFVVLTDDADAVLSRLRREGEAPRRDFVELALQLDAEILSLSDVRRARPGSTTHLIARAAGEPAALAWLAARKGGRTYLALSEDVGLPLAALLRRRPDTTSVVIAHRIGTPGKKLLVRALSLFESLGGMICLNREQELFALRELGAPRARVHCFPFQVDHRFFCPAGEPLTSGTEDPAAKAEVVSVGRELRDYPTLFRAVSDTEIPVTVVASSPWSRKADETRNREIPRNVTLRKGLTMVELRELYRRAAVVVVPVQDVDYPAGVTSMLEAQATGKPVIVSASRGLLDSIAPDTAIVVPCGDHVALKRAIEDVLSDPAEARRLGERGRRAVLEDKTLDHYTSRVTRVCRDAEKTSLAGSGDEPRSRVAGSQRVLDD